jgi:hypothetical protein
MMIIDQKQELLEQNEKIGRKTASNLEDLQRKVERLQSNPASDLQEKLENYRALTMCSSCNNSFKTHLLLKCMHTFWFFQY